MYSLVYKIISMKNTNPSIVALNHLIAAYTVTAQNARFCHWNVVGPHFEDDHELFGEIYDALSDEVDLFAERVRALREFPISSLATILTETRLSEYILPMTARQMQKSMLADYEHIAVEMERMIESTAKDPVTQDIIVGSKRAIDKKSWMLRSLL
jgi:starvation-inducible DNA-binding protein